MCDKCEWEDAVNRCEAIVEALPKWKTSRKEFFESMAETMLKLQHATPRQLEVIADVEDELED